MEDTSPGRPGIFGAHLPELSAFHTACALRIYCVLGAVLDSGNVQLEGLVPTLQQHLGEDTKADPGTGCPSEVPLTCEDHQQIRSPPPTPSTGLAPAQHDLSIK